MNDLAEKIDKRNDKIYTPDGLSFLEKQRQKKNEKNAKTYEQLTGTRDDLQQQVSYTKLYKTPGESVGGKTFRKGSYNGETLYMIGAKGVDKAIYDAEMKRLKANSNTQTAS